MKIYTIHTNHGQNDENHCSFYIPPKNNNFYEIFVVIIVVLLKNAIQGTTILAEGVSFISFPHDKTILAQTFRFLVFFLIFLLSQRNKSSSKILVHIQFYLKTKQNTILFR